MDSFMISKAMAHLMPFSVDKKPVLSRIVTKDGMGVEYKTETTIINEFDVKVLLVIAKVCLDDDDYKDACACDDVEDHFYTEIINIEKKAQSFWSIGVDLQKFARFMDKDGRNRKVMRRRIYDSLVKLSKVEINFYEKMDGHKVFDIVTTSNRWINGVSLDILDSTICISDDPINEAHLYVSHNLLKSLILTGHSTSNPAPLHIETTKKYEGKAFYLHLFMQKQTNPFTMKGGKKGFKYNDYIDHDEVVRVLKLKDEKNINHVIKKAFKELGLNYNFYTTSKGIKKWKKQK